MNVEEENILFSYKCLRVHFDEIDARDRENSKNGSEKKKVKRGEESST